MASLTSPGNDTLIATKAAVLASGSSSSSSAAAIDDDFDDACSICLEPFSLDDPSTLTTCKHEYHLHCILEWSQRSKECPICWQSLALKDPASQELLSAVEKEKNARRRSMSTNRRAFPHNYQETGSEYGPHWTSDPDLSDQIVQQLAAMMSRARQGRRNGRLGHSERTPSPVSMFRSRVSDPTMHPNTPEECSSAYASSGGSSPTSSISSIDAQPPLSPTPLFVNLSSGSASEGDIPYLSRTLQGQSSDSTARPRSSELLALSESIKSRLSAASARYKDSIFKGTQGFREKLLARKSSVRELSTGVQREMNAGIAGVARMIERLDLKSKRNSNAGDGQNHPGQASNFLSKGKGLLDNILVNTENCAAANGGSNSHRRSKVTGSISSQQERGN